MGPITQSTPSRWTKKRFLFGAGILTVIAALILSVGMTGWTEIVDDIVMDLRSAGPLVFFVAMAVLPAVGFPMIAFTLAVGPVFAPTMGTAWVVADSIAAVVANLLLSYWLANRALRPFVGRLLNYFEFHLPDRSAAGAWPMTLIVRLTPGPPFWVQSYLLGLMRVPLMPYLVVSTLVMSGYIVALVCGGEAIANGDGRLAVTAVGGVVIFGAVLQLVRQRIALRRTAAVVMIHRPHPIPAK